MSLEEILKKFRLDEEKLYAEGYALGYNEL